MNNHESVLGNLKLTLFIGTMAGELLNIVVLLMPRSDSDYYVGNTIRELCLTRSVDIILNTIEINVLIKHLCSS